LSLNDESTQDQNNNEEESQDNSSNGQDQLLHTDLAEEILKNDKTGENDKQKIDYWA